MACFNFVATRDWCFRLSFSNAGLKSSSIDLGDGTAVHIWMPRSHKESKPTLLLIQGIGANAMWQWSDFISPLSAKFNIYVPDLLFFGESYTTRPERTEDFQAECLMRTLKVLGVTKLNVVGISYGGFVGYSLAAQFPEAVEKVVVICGGVCMEENDMDNGMFKVKNVDEAFVALFPQTPEKMRETMRIAFYKPKKNVPSCILSKYIDAMCSENLLERKELIEALYNGRKLSNLPKIKQPTLILWGKHDQVFPVELGHRLKRHLGENAELVIIENAGHALNIEKPKELCQQMLAFFADILNPPPPSMFKVIFSNSKVD